MASVVSFKEPLNKVQVFWFVFPLDRVRFVLMARRWSSYVFRKIRFMHFLCIYRNEFFKRYIREERNPLIQACRAVNFRMVSVRRRKALETYSPPKSSVRGPCNCPVPPLFVNNDNQFLIEFMFSRWGNLKTPVCGTRFSQYLVIWNNAQSLLARSQNYDHNSALPKISSIPQN